MRFFLKKGFLTQLSGKLYTILGIYIIKNLQNSLCSNLLASVNLNKKRKKKDEVSISAVNSEKHLVTFRTFQLLHLLPFLNSICSKNL